MDNNDDYLLLLAGFPIDISPGLQIYPIKLKDILKLGEIKYFKLLSMLIISKSSLKLEVEANNFEIFMNFYYNDKEYKNAVDEAFQLFCSCEVAMNNNGYILLNDIIIDEKEFDRMQSILMQQNFLKEEKEEKVIYANEKSRELAEKIRMAKAQVQAMSKEKTLRLGDIISIVSAYSENVNIFNVWELTVFQLYDNYIRLLMKDSYDAKFSMMIAGTDIKEELKHWNSRLLLESE